MHRALLLCLLLAAACCVRAGEVQVAAASNLGAVIERIAAAFARDTGHRAVVSTAATGNLAAQVRNGAPYEVLLAADQDTPARLEAEGLARADTRFTYAIGRLVLWAPRDGVVDAAGEVLRQPPRGRLAVADPQLSSYGAAALEALRTLEVYARWEKDLLAAAGAGAAFEAVASGKAAMGLVALSHVAEDGRVARGAGWVLPGRLHAPIQQDAVLLNAGNGNPAAIAFLVYLRGNAARAILRSAGYMF